MHYYKKLRGSPVFYILWAVCLGFATGVLFQKYYSVDRLLRDVGLRTELTNQLQSRKPVAPSFSPSDRLMVAVAFGQSNSANFANTKTVSQMATYNFFAGNLYAARDPMIGAQGMGGSVWPLLGDSLQETGVFDAVVFATIGVGGSEIARWAPEGDLHTLLLDVLDELRDAGLTVTHLLWHQGEKDAQLGTAPAAYRKAFNAMLLSIRRHGIKAPIYVSQATRCYEIDDVEALRNAQKALYNRYAAILPGPDTDTLGAEYRYDGCHFSAKGLKAASSLWLGALLTYAASHVQRSEDW